MGMFWLTSAACTVVSAELVVVLADSFSGCAEISLAAGVSAGETPGDFFSRINLRRRIAIASIANGPAQPIPLFRRGANRTTGRQFAVFFPIERVQRLCQVRRDAGICPQTADFQHKTRLSG
jgi:hypothetical protein